jgi:hypothetical protein
MSHILLTDPNILQFRPPFLCAYTLKLSECLLFHTDKHINQYTSEGIVKGNTVIRAKIEQNLIADELRRLGRRFKYMDVFDQDNEIKRVVDDYKALRAKMRVSKGDVVSE